MSHAIHVTLTPFEALVVSTMLQEIINTTTIDEENGAFMLKTCQDILNKLPKLINKQE